MSLNFLDSLLENDAIQLQVEASDWKQAIAKTSQPLLKKGCINEQYLESIYKTTEQYGPYYIIADGLAMPHASTRSDDEVLKDCFALATLAKPIKFLDDPREVSVVVVLAARTADIHTGQALPQIVAVFEDESNIIKMTKATTKDQIIAIIKGVDLNKYTNKE